MSAQRFGFFAINLVSSVRLIQRFLSGFYKPSHCCRTSCRVEFRIIVHPSRPSRLFVLVVSPGDAMLPWAVVPLLFAVVDIVFFCNRLIQNAPPLACERELAFLVRYLTFALLSSSYDCAGNIVTFLSLRTGLRFLWFRVMTTIWFRIEMNSSIHISQRVWSTRIIR